MTESQWQAWRLQDDPVGMAAYTAISAGGSTGTQGRLHFLHEIDILDEGALRPIPDDLPLSVRELFADTDIPAWLQEYGDIERATAVACDTFHDDIVAFVLALLCKSLPECYAGRRGAKVLAYTGALGEPNYQDPTTQNTLVRRVVETAVFVRNIHRRDLWQGADPIAIRTIHKVRVFHCGIRTMIERRNADGTQVWDYDDLGIPINQQDLLATNLAFSLQSIRGAKSLGVSISADEYHSIILHWARVGYYLGIDEQLLRAFIEAPEPLWDLVVKNEFMRSNDGHALTAAMVQFLHMKVFSAARHAHLPELFMRRLMDSTAVESVDLDSLPKPSGASMVAVIGTLLLLLHRVVMGIPFIGKKLLTVIGADIVEITVASWAGERNPHITLSKELQGV